MFLFLRVCSSAAADGELLVEARSASADFRRKPRAALALAGLPVNWAIGFLRAAGHCPSALALIAWPLLSVNSARGETHPEQSQRRGRCGSWAPHLPRRSC